MFQGLLIAATPDRCRVLSAVVHETEQILLLRMLDYYPQGYALTRLVNSLDADLVLVDLSDPEAAGEIIAEVRSQRPMVALIGYGAPPDANFTASEAGLSAVLPYPMDAPMLAKAVEESLHLLRAALEPNLLAFLPAKAGSGASTVVLNTAVALAGALGKKVLVLETDLRSGTLGIALNLTPQYSIAQALQGASDLDAFRFENFVVRKFGVDLLLANPFAATHFPQWHEYFLLLDFVKKRYDYILVDLPELVNPATREIVQRSRLVFVVCTPEVPSLRLAGRRLEELRAWQVPDDRLHMILNRENSTDIRPAELEGFFQRPFFAGIPNDYKALRAAMLDGRPIQEKSTLGRAFKSFAEQLARAVEDIKPATQSKWKSLLGRG